MGIFSFPNSKHNEPRLTTVTEIPIKDGSSVALLRQTIYSLTLPVWEDVFLRCGFPRDDGRRPFFKHEAQDKLGFISDRLFEQVGNARKWVRDSTSADVFFKYYAELEQDLLKLSRLEVFADYYAPIPSEQLSTLRRDKDRLQVNLIKRAWDAALRSAGTLTSLESKRMRADSCLELMKLHRHELTRAAQETIDKLKASIDEAVIQPPPEKPKPAFDEKIERELLRDYRSARTETDKHFARNQLISFLYKYRHVDALLARCKAICLEDIEALERLDAEGKSRMLVEYEQSVSLLGYSAKREKDFKQTYEREFSGVIPAFEKLIMIYSNAGDFSNALKYCDMAINRCKRKGLLHEEYDKKRLRIVAKSQR